ncbi:hypothetical protein BC332_02580 [Capsicum chinense]|nr:hypothetical protein BC332_02580 [Capsicum chinense]
MVYFRDSAFSSSESRYLIISDHKDSKVKTKLFIGTGDNPSIPISKWIQFWGKEAFKYEPLPLRRENKSIRLKSSHNPTGKLDKVVNWSSKEEGLFHKLGFKSDKKDDTYLASFLSCWLCVFVFPTMVEDVIRPGVFGLLVT